MTPARNRHGRFIKQQPQSQLTNRVPQQIIDWPHCWQPPSPYIFFGPIAI